VTFLCVLPGYQAVHHGSDRAACVTYRTDSRLWAFKLHLPSAIGRLAYTMARCRAR
jgi:hypothetical protein